MIGEGKILDTIHQYLRAQAAKGGRARAKTMAPKARRAQARKAARARWAKRRTT